MDNFYDIIKSIHTISKLPIHVFNENFVLKTLYVSDHIYTLPYDFKSYFDKCRQKNVPYLFSGMLDEFFLRFTYKKTILILGPFITNSLSKQTIEKKIEIVTKDENLKTYLSRYLDLLPIFSLNNVRDILVLLDFVFNGNASHLYSEGLNHQIHLNKINFSRNILSNYNKHSFNAEKDLYYFEMELLNLVNKGDLKELKKSLSKISNIIIPNMSEDPVCAEKIYTIILLEKISSQSVQLGHDITDIYRLRDFYIKQLDNKTNLMDILYVRETAIIHFTKKTHDLLEGNYSPMVKSIIQFIGLNIYNSIKISDITDNFFVTESTIRSKFKKETGLSVIEYINKRKINESKLLLKSGLSPIEVSEALDYYDYSHFYKMFKKFTGTTPKEYQSCNNIFDKNKIK